MEFHRFVAEMRPDQPHPISRGRSSTKLHVHDEHGNHYEMFMADIGYFMMAMDKGSVFGVWYFRKQGANYGMYCERAYIPRAVNGQSFSLWYPVPTWEEQEVGCELQPIKDLWSLA